MDGERVDLSSFKGSWILLDAMATCCGPCCNEIRFWQNGRAFARSEI